MSTQPTTRPSPRPVPGELPPRWVRSIAKPGRYLHTDVVCAVWGPADKMRVHVEDTVDVDRLGAFADDLRALRGWLSRGGR